MVVLIEWARGRVYETEQRREEEGRKLRLEREEAARRRRQSEETERERRLQAAEQWWCDLGSGILSAMKWLVIAAVVCVPCVYFPAFIFGEIGQAVEGGLVSPNGAGRVTGWALGGAVGAVAFAAVAWKVSRAIRASPQRGRHF
jgi:hypothetical protein